MNLPNNNAKVEVKTRDHGDYWIVDLFFQIPKDRAQFDAFRNGLQAQVERILENTDHTSKDHIQESVYLAATLDIRVSSPVLVNDQGATSRNIDPDETTGQE